MAMANHYSRPVEIMQLHITPSDFFTKNPAIDVPSYRDLTSKQVVDGVNGSNGCCKQESPTR